MYDLLVLNGLVVTGEETGEFDIAVAGGKVSKVAPRGSLSTDNAKKVIDTEGGLVMPGGIDAHVHLDEPPLYGKGVTADNYETGIRSAIAGATTTKPRMPGHEITVIPTTAFHLICSNAGPTAISEFAALREAGISSLKIYMTYDALQLNDSEILRRPPPYCRDRGHTPIIIVHVSTPAAANHLSNAQKKGLPVYAETCPQYLFLTRKDLDKPGFEGAKCVCSPPLREGEGDHEGIWRGIEDGTFTILSSDHCPFVYDDSEKGKKSVITPEYPNGHFKYISNGCPGVETRLALTLTADRLSLEKFVEVTSTNSAKLYGLYPKKGALIPGSDADITIWYPEGMKEFELQNEMLHHNVDYTPYSGRAMKQWPRYTILRGSVV